MSGRPNLPDIADLRTALKDLHDADIAVESATFIKYTAEKSIAEAQDKQRNSLEKINTLMRNMDVAQPGNYGYHNRLLVLLKELAVPTPPPSTGRVSNSQPETKA